MNQQSNVKEVLKKLLNNDYSRKDYFEKLEDYNDDNLKYILGRIVKDVLWIQNKGILEVKERVKLESLMDRKDFSSNLFISFVQKYIEERTFYRDYSPNYNEYQMSCIINDSIEEIKYKKYKGFTNDVNKLTGGLPESLYKIFFETYCENVKTTNYYECVLEFSDGTKYDMILGGKTASMSYEYIKPTFFKSSLIDPDNKKLPKKILEKFIHNNEEFWNHYTLKDLLRVLKKYNENFYIKFCDNLRKKIEKLPFGKEVIKNGYPLHYLCVDEVREIIKDYRLSQLTKFLKDPNVTEVNSEYFLYPYCDIENINDILSEGKEVFESFVKEYFNNSYEKIYAYFYNDLNLEILSGEKMVDNFVSEIMYPEWKDRNVCINRFFVYCYLIKKVYKEEVNRGFFAHYKNVLQRIENNLNIKRRALAENNNHDEIYVSLENMLVKYDVIMKERENYLISLMDYDYANYKQIEMFPQLEQIGDAVYGLMVVDLLFHNPNTYQYIQGERQFNISSKQQELVSAEKQVEIAKKLGINKLYLGNVFAVNQTIFEKGEKIYADSYEMLIGAIYLDYGFEKAYDFAKKTFLEVYNEYSFDFECEYTDDIFKLKTYEAVYDEHIYKDNMLYFNKYYSVIHPSSSFLIDSSYYNNFSYDSLIDALDKMIKIELIGNDTKGKRSFCNWTDIFDIFQKNVKTNYNGKELRVYYSGKDLIVYRYLNYGYADMIKEAEKILEIEKIQKKINTEL